MNIQYPDESFWQSRKKFKILMLKKKIEIKLYKGAMEGVPGEPSFPQRGSFSLPRPQ